MKNIDVKVAERPTAFSIVSQKLRDYGALVKFRLNITVVISALLAFLIASDGDISWLAMVILGLGGFLVTGASNALNQVLEKDYDALMARTADRPLAAGRMQSSEGVLAAGLMSLVGITLLAMFNIWAAFLGMMALISYAFVYTPMKRVSPVAITIGAFPGALPTLIGCVAFEGTLTWLGVALFALQFLWQFPHFISIGWLGFEDYRKAGYKLIPTIDNQRDPSVGLHATVYALLLIPIAWVPYAIGATGVVSAITISILSLAYAGFGWNLYQKNNRKAALQLMFSSFFYLPVSLIILLLDKI